MQHPIYNFIRYLHHIQPPLSFHVVVCSIIQIYVLLLDVDTAFAAVLPDLAVCAAHVDEAKDGEHDRNGDQDVVNNCFGVRARFLVGIEARFNR